jgi:hypothetical protein
VERVEGTQAEGAKEASLENVIEDLKEAAGRLTAAAAPAATSPNGARIGSVCGSPSPNLAKSGPIAPVM